MTKVLELTEHYPSPQAPVAVESVQKHIECLSEYCEVHLAVPLRLIPRREFFSSFKNLPRRFTIWFRETLNCLTHRSLSNPYVHFYWYLFLPKSLFWTIDRFFVLIFLYRRCCRLIRKRNIDVVFCHWIHPCGLLGKVLARRFNTPFVIALYENLDFIARHFGVSALKMELALVRQADAVVVQSEATRKILLRYLPSIATSKIYLGVEFAARESVDALSNQSVPNRTELVTVARLDEPEKNIDLLIKAVARLNSSGDGLSYHLTIVGDGNLRPKLEELAEQLEVAGCITFVGTVKQADVWHYLSGKDIFVLPSTMDSFGSVYIEALYCGVPIIGCSGVGVVDELAGYGDCVERIEPNSLGGLTESIRTLAHDRKRRETMGKIGRQIVQEHFTWEQHALEHYGLFQRLISERRKEQ